MSFILIHLDIIFIILNSSLKLIVAKSMNLPRYFLSYRTRWILFVRNSVFFFFPVSPFCFCFSFQFAISCTVTHLFPFSSLLAIFIATMLIRSNLTRLGKTLFIAKCYLPSKYSYLRRIYLQNCKHVNYFVVPS
uniref:Uncharacterized protein n=1 Tax=Cacopsylla melanoneura TaxID=428564 RepID=A0A8D8ZD81_9HEMI